MDELIGTVNDKPRFANGEYRNLQQDRGSPYHLSPGMRTYHERVLRSVANSTRQDAREFLELAAQVPVHTEIELFPLEKANQAIAAMKHSRVKGAAVLKVNPRLRG